MTGIYMIRFGDDENAYYYIGQSANIEQRKWNHLSKLRSGTHKNSYMQSVFNKYGEESMTFEILCECTEDKLDEFEEYYIYAMQTFVGDNSHGLNLNTGGNGNRNVSEETRAKNSEWHKGKKRSDETKAKISKAGKGKKRSNETRAKIGEANKRLKSKPVLCVELEKHFPSVREANRFMKKEFGFTINVGKVLTGRDKTAGGFHWEYYSQKEMI